MQDRVNSCCCAATFFYKARRAASRACSQHAVIIVDIGTIRAGEKKVYFPLTLIERSLTLPAAPNERSIRAGFGALFLENPLRLSHLMPPKKGPLNERVVMGLDAL